MVLAWWKIVNVKSLQINKSYNDPPNDTRLDFIIEFGKIALNMAGSQGNHKKTIIPKHCQCHTSYLLWNCLSMSTPFSYKSWICTTWEIFNWSVRKRICKFCQGPSGTYLINVPQCQNVNIDEFDVNPDHQCISCDYKLCQEDSEIFDNLKNLESSLSNEIKITLVYIAGYITSHDNQPSECETHFYYEKYEKYTNLTNCGKLNVPSDHAWWWVFLFCFILFHTVKEKVCYKSLSNIFMLMSEFHFFNMEKNMLLFLQI